MQLTRFITAGNVDDGKSTLIGRLLYDSHAISNDILETIQQHNGEIKLAFLTDGLKSEREQGITIDVAYKYFSTEKRKFIIADCPGHKEYTRNMITGASHADITIILIDAINGITEQTKRHTFIADLMNVPCVIFCINKMDAVNYDENIFLMIKEQMNDFKFINTHQIEFVPVSALKGDNVVNRSDKMHWYNGHTLLYLLENFDPVRKGTELSSFIQIQYVTFENNERYFYGQVYGEFYKNEEIIIYPTQQKNIIKDIFVAGKKIDKAQYTQPIAFTLQDDTDLQRGYFVLSTKNLLNENIENKIHLSNKHNAICVWMDDTPLIPTKRYYIQHHSFKTYLKFEKIEEVFNLDNLQFDIYQQQNISMNTIFKASFITAQPLLVADYRQSDFLGSFIIIDENSHKTAGAGIVLKTN